MEIASSIEFEKKPGRISFELLITPCVAQHNNFDKSTTSTYKENAAEVSHDSGSVRKLQTTGQERGCLVSLILLLQISLGRTHFSLEDEVTCLDTSRAEIHTYRSVTLIQELKF